MALAAQGVFNHFKKRRQGLGDVFEHYPPILHIKKEVDKIISYETVRKNTKLDSFVEEKKEKEEE